MRVTLEHPYVFIVLEHANAVSDAVVHGIYTDRKCAEGKRRKLVQTRGWNQQSGYFSILKKPIQGPQKIY